MVNRIVIAVAFLILFPINSALSLVYRESDGLFVYYPESGDRIATRLIEKFPSMRDFLEKQGLPLKYPLHVILDNNLDRPVVAVKIIPHHEIHIPMRVPGVLEDGYLETDPWAYYFFKSLCVYLNTAIETAPVFTNTAIRRLWYSVPITSGIRDREMLPSTAGGPTPF